MASFVESQREAIDDKPVELLAELFYDRFFYNDLISSHDDAQLASANMLAMLAFPGLLCLHWIPKYYVTLKGAPEAELALSVLGDRFFWLTFQMGVLGLVTTLQWERLFPDRRDYAILGPQPVTARVLFQAQAWALARFMAFHFAIANVAAAAFFPIAALPWTAGTLSAVAFAVGHWLSLVAVALFVVMVVAAMQGVLSNVLTPTAFDRVSPVAQALLMTLFLGMIILLPLMQMEVLAGVDTVHLLLDQSELAWWFPSMWFSALGEFVAGRGAGLGPLALAAVSSLFAVAVLTAGSYLLSYTRFLRRSLESPRRSRAMESRLARRLGGLVRRVFVADASERAVFLFTVKTLLRSRQQRLYLGAFLAVGCALVVAQTWALSAPSAPSHLLLAQPYVLLFLTLVGMRVVFSFPADLPAQWAFRFHAKPEFDRYLTGIRKALWMMGPGPLLCATTVGFLMFWGPQTAAVHLLVLGVCSWLSVEIILARFTKIPFTCNHVSGGAHVIIVWTFCAVGMLTYSGLFASIEMWVFKGTLQLALFAVGTGALAVAWKRVQPEFAPDPAGPIFHEDNHPVVHRLNLYDD